MAKDKLFRAVGIDYGTVRIGVAVSDDLGMLAHPHEYTPESAYYLLTPNVKIGTQKIERIRKWLLRRVDAETPS